MACLGVEALLFRISPGFLVGALGPSVICWSCLCSVSWKWSHVTGELTTRQDGMVNRLTRIEGHLNHVAADQNNAIESSQETWTNSEMSLRIQNVSSNMELRS